MATIKILLADDHPVFTDGLSMILSSMPSVDVVATAQNGQQVMAILQQRPCDVAVMDINMPVMDGIETTRRIKAQYPSMHVLALSGSDDPEAIHQIIMAGAAGYLAKNSNREEIQKAITRVINGESYLSDPYVTDLGKSGKIGVDKKDELLAQLTEREIQVMGLICSEQSNAEIAERLFISQSTVETHRKNLIKKLDVKNSIGLVKIALHYGLVKLR